MLAYDNKIENYVILHYRLKLDTVITLKYLSFNVAVNIPIDPRTIMHVAIMIIWFVHRTGTVLFSIDILWHFSAALSYF